MAKKKVTSMDVAKLAGVSQSAVSLILNKSDKVVFSEETKERVKNATRQLGYQTPAHRRRKSDSDSKLIPILIPTLTNAYYSELVQCIEQYAGSLGYHVIICNTREDTALEKYYKYFHRFKDRWNYLFFSPQFSAAGRAAQSDYPYGHNRRKEGYLYLFDRAE